MVCRSLLLLGLTVRSPVAPQFSLTGSQLPTVTTWAVPGFNAKLYCDIKGEELSTVLWYKDQNSEPIYTYDNRGEYSSSAYHWTEKEPIGLGNRAEFITDKDEAYLLVSEVRSDDLGLYRCRVDFKHAQTRNQLVNLSLVEYPQSIKIFNNDQVVTNLVGPVNSGQPVNLRCVVQGGQPPASVHWMRNNELLDSTDEVVNGSVVNELILHEVGEEEALDRFACRAANNNFTKPLVRTVRIEVNFPPRSVEISELPDRIYAGKTHHLKCTARGSYPSAALSWWKAGQFLQRPQETKEEDDATVSFLYTQFQKEDNGRTLSCRAKNPVITNSTVEQSITLDVLYAPRADLRFGANINPTDIKDGQDVYIECSVDANPKINKILWNLNGFPVVPRKNIIMSGMNLVLQGVRREQSGNYTCTVSNTVGDAVSQPLYLRIKHKPICSRNSSADIFVWRGEVREVPCEVLSDPMPTNFWWTFNNSFQMGRLPQEAFSWAGRTSLLQYTTANKQDFGVVSCWSSNQLGTMEQPCVYNVWEAGTHTKSLDCSLQNQTLTSLVVSCSVEDAVKQQTVYHLEVREREGGELVQNLTSESPWFSIQDLPPEVSTSGLNLTVYTSDKSGKFRSRHTLGVFSSKVAELQADTNDQDLSPVYLLGIGAGSCLCVLLVLLAILIFIHLQRKRRMSLDLKGSSERCVYQPGREDEEDLRFPDDQQMYSGVDLLSSVSSSQSKHVVLREEIFPLKSEAKSSGAEASPSLARGSSNLLRPHQGNLQYLGTFQGPEPRDSKTLPKNVQFARSTMGADEAAADTPPRVSEDGLVSSGAAGDGSRDPLIQSSIGSLLVGVHQESIL